MQTTSSIPPPPPKCPQKSELQRSPHKTIEILPHFQLEVNASIKWLNGNIISQIVGRRGNIGKSKE
jgi:hypothetical protein